MNSNITSSIVKALNADAQNVRANDAWCRAKPNFLEHEPCSLNAGVDGGRVTENLLI
jgi:hypothetical protein